jgi:ATP phosphoribosyltransferase regulatory subunit HisZ
MPIVLEQIRLLFWDLLVTCVIFGAHSYESDTSLVLGTTSSCQSLNTCQWSLSLGFNGIVEWISHQSHVSRELAASLDAAG